MNKELKNWGMLLLLACVWGSSFILMKRGMTHKATGEEIFSPNQVAAMRMLLASLVVLPIGIKYIKIAKSAKIISSLLVVGFIGNFIPAFLFTYAETELSSGYAGMLNSCTPIFTLLIGYFIFKQQLISTQVIGVLIGSAGIVWLVNGVEVADTSGSLLHVLAVVLATLFYATSVNTIKNVLHQLKPIQITSVSLTFTFIPALILFLSFDTTSVIVHNPHALEALGYISILAIVGTSLSVIVFNQLIANSSALFASTVTYFIPIVALFIGIWDGEQFYIQQLLALLVVLSGVYIANVLARKNLKKVQ